MKKLIYLFSLCLAQHLPAQNAEADFAALNAQLMKAPNLVVETEYKVYRNHFSQTPEEVSHGLVKQKEHTIYQSIATLQVLMNERITLHLDTADRTLILSDPMDIAEQKKQAMQMDLKKVLSNCKTVTYKAQGEQAGVYYLEYKEDADTELERCELHINRKKQQVSKMVLYYLEEMEVDDEAPEKLEKPRLEIIFKKMDTSPKFGHMDFDEDLFIRRNGNTITPAPAYKGFKVIDNRYYSRPHK